MFDHLAKLEIDREARTVVELPEVSPKARVFVKPATEVNPFYYNAMLKRSGTRARRAVRTDRVTAEDSAAYREEDRDLFPRYVLVGWEGVTDKNNQPVPFNAETAREFCAKLPDWLFDRIRNAAATPERFVNESDPIPDPKVIAGN